MVRGPSPLRDVAIFFFRPENSRDYNVLMYHAPRVVCFSYFSFKDLESFHMISIKFSLFIKKK